MGVSEPRFSAFSLTIHNLRVDEPLTPTGLPGSLAARCQKPPKGLDLMLLYVEWDIWKVRSKSGLAEHDVTVGIATSFGRHSRCSFPLRETNNSIVNHLTLSSQDAVCRKLEAGDRIPSRMHSVSTRRLRKCCVPLPRFGACDSYIPQQLLIGTRPQMPMTGTESRSKRKIDHPQSSYDAEPTLSP
jgi:hypothetical protein